MDMGVEFAGVQRASVRRRIQGLIRTANLHGMCVSLRAEESPDQGGHDHDQENDGKGQGTGSGIPLRDTGPQNHHGGRPRSGRAGKGQGRGEKLRQGPSPSFLQPAVLGTTRL